MKPARFTPWTEKKTAGGILLPPTVSLQIYFNSIRIPLCAKRQPFSYGWSLSSQVRFPFAAAEHPVEIADLDGIHTFSCTIRALCHPVSTLLFPAAPPGQQKQCAPIFGAGGIMKLRTYQPKDCAALAELFFQTVHTVNSKDYTKAQLNAWATGNIDLLAWNESFLKHNTILAETGETIAGFGDMDDSGCIDRLFVHRDYQNKGIATAIAEELERQAVLHGIYIFTTYASITAKPFFELRGYRVVRENTVVRGNITLTNFTMKKTEQDERTGRRPSCL